METPNIVKKSESIRSAASASTKHLSVLPANSENTYESTSIETNGETIRNELLKNNDSESKNASTDRPKTVKIKEPLETIEENKSKSIKELKKAEKIPEPTKLVTHASTNQSKQVSITIPESKPSKTKLRINKLKTWILDPKSRCKTVFIALSAFLALFSLVLVIAISVVSGQEKPVPAEYKVCNTDSDCDTSKLLMCSKGLCVCSLDTYWPSMDATKCVPQLDYNFKCSYENTLECLESRGLSCQQVETSHYCRCHADSFWNATKYSCEPQLSIFSTCSDALQCSQSKGLTCKMDSNQAVFSCQCESGLYWSSSTCVPQLTYYQKCKYSGSPECNSKIRLVCAQDPSMQPYFTCQCDVGLTWNGSECN